MADTQADRMMGSVAHWARDGAWLQRDLRLKDFMAVVSLVRDIADLAEDEGHHPDLLLHGYRNLRIRVQTHAVGGLTDNDFILAAKIERLWGQHA